MLSITDYSGQNLLATGAVKIHGYFGPGRRHKYLVSFGPGYLACYFIRYMYLFTLDLVVTLKSIVYIFAFGILHLELCSLLCTSYCCY